MARRASSRRKRTPSFQEQFAAMNAFMRSLKEGQSPDRPPLLYGPERYIWRKAVDMLAEQANRPLQRLDVSELEPAEVLRHLSHNDLFGGAPAFLWLDHVEAWKKEIWDAVLRQVGQRPVVFTTLSETPPLQDERVLGIPFPPLVRNRKLFEQWVRAELKRRELRLSREAGRFLLEHLPDQLESVSRVLDMLELYMGDSRELVQVEEMARFLQVSGAQVYALVDGWLEGNGGRLWRQWTQRTLDLPVLTRFLPHALWDMIRAQARDTSFSLRYAWKRKTYARIASLHPTSDLWWAMAELAQRTLRERTAGAIGTDLSDTYWLARMSRTSFQSS